MQLKFGPLLFVPGILLFVITTILLVIPGDKLPETDFDFVDKLVHIGLFFVLTILFTWPFKYSALAYSRRKSWFISITLYAVAYGIIMEFVQEYLVTNRSYDELDMLFDAVGSTLAYGFSIKLFAKK